jgi:hypothetical protein
LSAANRLPPPCLWNIASRRKNLGSAPTRSSAFRSTAAGFVLRTSEGVETLSIEIADDQIVAIYGIRNPDKLRHLS